METNSDHIVMLPYMAHGHLIPFFSLATLIQKRTGYTITIANTPLNIKYLKSTMPQSSPIKLAELPFSSSDHNLPPNTENTEMLQLSQIGLFFGVSVTLKPHLLRLVSGITEKEGRPPLCIISDTFFGWAVEVAEAVGTVNITFSTGGAYGTAAYFSIWQNLPHRKTDSDEFSVPGFPERCRFSKSQLHKYIREADGTDIWSRFMQTQFELSLRSHGWLCNTVEEIEPSGLQVLRDYLNLPVWCVSSSGQRIGKKNGVSEEQCIKWLDSKEDGSVLYISFGSQNTIRPAQMIELATGLEQCGKNFIWVIRPPLGFDIRGKFRREWLPDGFEERMGESKKGLLVRDWAPQLEILSHRAVGGFLSHCGWNSVLESLGKGIPLIGWPLAAEQAYNSKMLMEDMGVAVEVARGIESDVKGGEVKKVIEIVMRNVEMKKQASEVAEKIRISVTEECGEVGSCVRALDEFLKSVMLKKQG